MSDTITLGDLTTELIYEAGIDGKTGATARHVTARLYALINRSYKQLRSRVSHNGDDFFRSPGTATTIPARASGEDWIELPFPTGASEILSVDVRIGGAWYDLAKGTWATRRVYPGGNRPQSPGEWTVLSMPQPSTTTVTAGKLVIWPADLTGSYKIDSLPHWVPLTDATHVFVLFPDWEEWILTKCTMVISQRDNQKRAMFLDAQERNLRAEAAILQHARRHARGATVPRRRDGLEL
jgi:hypothetical protein